MDIIIPKAEKFVINDVEVSIDPLKISIFKEGLNYSWKTLRTKASSKIVNGNSVFHLKLSMVFTKSMFLELHRLVCQMRNSPLVQITNELVSESAGLNAKTPTFFSVSSLQIIPRSDSPYTMDLELDLKYFNQRKYAGNNLAYKKYFESTVKTKSNGDTYVSAFSVYEDNLVELPLETDSSNAKSSRKVSEPLKEGERIRKYNLTQRVPRAKDSFAYIRYSNYLQVQSLINSFLIPEPFLRDTFGEDINNRECVPLHKHNSKVTLLKRDEIWEKYYDIEISYQEYLVKEYSESESKALKKYFYDQTKNIKSYEARTKKVSQLKKEFLESDSLPEELKSVKESIQNIARDKSINMYSGRKGVNNVFFISKGLEVALTDSGEAPTTNSKAVITSLACGFTNLISSLPISGQEFPVHQYMGASEPIYNVSLVGRPDQKDARGLNSVVKEFELMRRTLQWNAVNFKLVPDGSYFEFNSFFTKLLGSTKPEYNPVTTKPTNRHILKNFNVNTIEGAPGSQALQFSFSETNNFAEEEIKPVYTLGGSDRIKSRVKSLLSSGIEEPRQNKKADINYIAYQWKTSYFNADEYYRKAESKGLKRTDFDKQYDKAAYDFCMEYLDNIQGNVTGKIIIMSSIDQPSTGIRNTRSRHYSGQAVDITVQGMTKLDLMRAIAQTSEALDLNPIGVIAYYDSPEELTAEVNNGAPIPMTAGGSNGFVHVDSRVIVERYNSDGEEVTTRNAANRDDTFEVLEGKSGTFYAIDANSAAGYVKKIGEIPLKDYLLSENSGSPIIIGGGEATDENEIDEEKDFIEVIKDIRPIISKKFSPFSTNETEDLQVGIKKYKDLSEEEQTIIQSRFSLNELNPELEIRVIESESSDSLEAFTRRLSNQGYAYQQDKNKSKIYLPRNAANTSLAKESLEAKSLINMYDRFEELASLILTEPKLYADNAKVETDRIKDELSSTELEPSMVGNFLGSLEYASGNQSFTEDIFSGAGEGGSLGAATGFIAAKAGVGLATAIGTGVGLLGGVGLISTYYNSYVAGGNNYARGYSSLLTDIDNLAGDKISAAKTDSIERDVAGFYSDLGESDHIGIAFTKLLNYAIAERDVIKAFERDSLNLKDRLSIINALGNYKSISNATANDGFKLEGALSEEIFVGELRRLFTYYFGFPYIDEKLGNQEDFQDLYEIDETGEYKPLYPENLYIPSSGKKYRIIDDDEGFPFTKEQLKAQQNQKIGYLKNLKDQILEAIASIPEVKQKIGIESSYDIFDVSGENAYPDILLPVDPAHPEKNVNLHPTFFFYSNTDGELGYNYINPNMEANINTVLTRSQNATKALEKGVYTGSIKELKRDKELLTLDVSSTEQFDKILRAGDYRLGAENDVDSSGKTTDLEATSEPNDPETAKRVAKQFTEFKKLRKSFDDIFGESSVNKKREDVKEETDAVDSFTEAVQSCKNLMQPKKQIDKAFPTYKLYLIEEDSNESDKLSVYDDFYAYNGVKSFTVTSHKDMPASTAVIQIQNISGVLDGTKPEVVRDIDIKQDLKPDEELERQSAVSSIIMRPGINIQLRAGYSANPNKLDIIFTGRVTEVKNSSTGEMLEVVAQSFGVELIAKKLGSIPGDPLREKKFYNTHSILGSLMLSEELKHFGRVKTGRRFQTGEAKSPSLDMGTGKDETWVNFDATNWILDTLNDYGLAIAVGSLVLGSVSNVGKLAVTNSGNAALSWIGKGTQQFKDLIKAAEVWSPTAATTTATGTANSLVNISRSAGNVSLTILQKIFIKVPTSVFNFTRNLGISKNIKNIENINQLSGATRTAAIYKNLSPRRLQGLRNGIRSLFRKSDLPELTDAALDSALIRKYGYDFCFKNNLLSELNYTSAVLKPLESAIFGSVRYFKNVLATFATAMVVGVIVDAVILGLSTVGDFAGAWLERTNPVSTKILLSPQDDNIFPPPPEEYLVRRSAWDTFLKDSSNIGRKALRGASRFMFGLLSYASTSGDPEKARAIKNAYKKGDTRLSTLKKENEYSVENSTIWEVLHEMSLRHPGYLYGIRKYGNGLESRVFFGKSSQRYFSKEISKKDADFLNKLDKIFLANKNQIKDTPVNLIREVASNVNDDNKLAILGSLLEYWNEKTKERFIPYRKYHSIDSEHDIINNSLRVESSKVVNQVNVIFKEDGEEVSTKLKAVPYIKESMVNEKSINYPNCKGVALASRYAMSELVNAGKQMYSGEILIVGNPKIETDDVCILSDDYLNMHGPIEVQAVTHMFSYETGFVTEITPNAVLFSKDEKIINNLNASFVFEARRRLLDKYPDKDAIINNKGNFIEAKLEELVDEALVSYFSESDSGTFNNIYRMLSVIPGVTDYSELSETDRQRIKKEVKQTLKNNLKEGNLLFLSDITENIEIGSQLSEGGKRLATTLAIGGASVYGVSKLGGLANRALAEILNPGQSVMSGLGNVGASIGSANYKALGGQLLKSLALFGAALYTGRAIGESGGLLLNKSLKSGKIGKNLFRDILMTQVDYGQLITLMPVVKDGKPLAAGGYEYIRQRDRFKEVLGEYFNPIKENLEAFHASMNEKVAEAELIGVKKYSEQNAWPVKAIDFTIREGLEYLSSEAIPEDSINMFLLEEGE